MGDPAIRVRWAEVRDAEAILRVYAPYVETPVTFETRVPRLDEFEDRMKGIVLDYPYLVAEDHGEIVGFAYAHRIGERDAYAWNAELSVYLDRAHCKRGWGRALSQAVIDLLALQGVRNVFSLITVPNAASVKMHERLGFTHMGTQRRAGYKCGGWHDVAWMQKQLGGFEGEPRRRSTVQEIDWTKRQAALLEAERAIGGTGEPIMPKIRGRRAHAGS
ncbi:GNAT family N-acetyltransferase [Arabiibacter massiliensis]|uniref:GNAT family N-acetyltransferase n=1 Tax=Arabiibacter massiliensis TaxID=1870985 RepID=UPI00155A5F73|nr:GNAT family N-acetyltransferase [Arabiibacter massiliensis]